MIEDLKQVQKKLWETEQEILDVIHSVCVENGLRYSLAYGTLLGAVRHGGFIPWDDDVDVMMPREDYETLIKIWPDVAPEGFLLETERMYDDFLNTFLKIRKNHTTFLQEDFERESSHHKGIFVDIFPADRRANGAIAGTLQYIEFAISLLFNRGHESGTKGIVGLGERILLRVVPKKYYRKLSNFTGAKSRRWNDNDKAELVFPCTISSCREFYPADLFDHLELIPFNGKSYYAIYERHQFLTICYGDYIQLPPEEERIWKHHPILIDFEHNYEELVSK